MPRYTAKRVDNKYQSHTDNGILLYLTDDTTSNMTAFIPGRNTVVIIYKYIIINAHPSDFGFQENIHTYIPDGINLPPCLQEGAEPNQEDAKPTSILPQEGSPPHNLQNLKLCSISPFLKTVNILTLSNFPRYTPYKT